MKLGTKMVLGVGLLSSAFLLVQGFTHLRSELRVLEGDVRRHDHLLGRTLTAALREVWASQGEARARDLLAEIDREDPSVRVSWLDLEGAILDAAALRELRQGRELLRIGELPDGTTVLRTYLPLTLPGRGTGAVVVAEALTSEVQIVGDVVRRTAALGLGFLTLALFLSFAMGKQVVQRPVAALVDRLRRVGEGRFEGPAALPTGDELGLLAEEIEKMSRRLALARDELEAAQTAKRRAETHLQHAARVAVVGRLAAGLAHELGTPLGIVVGRAALLSEDERLPSDARSGAQAIREQTQRVSELVRQLLDLARRREPKKVPHDLGRTIAEVADLLGPEANRRGVELLSEAPSDIAGVHADPVQMRQVALNLVLNAIQASGHGGWVRVTLEEARAAPPTAPEAASTPCICLHVEDRGCGIAPEHVEHLFEPFFTTKPEGQGTGLGLPIAWGIVEDHGGWIGVESRPGQGSRFTVYLPVEPGAA